MSALLIIAIVLCSIALLLDLAVVLDESDDAGLCLANTIPIAFAIVALSIALGTR